MVQTNNFKMKAVHGQKDWKKKAFKTSIGPIAMYI